MGYLYEKGLGCTRNLKKAVRLYEKAANEGMALVCVNLGILYENGTGVKKNLRTARQWYEKAAQSGSEKGREALNRLNSQGKAARVVCYGLGCFMAVCTILMGMLYFDLEGGGDPSDLRVLIAGAVMSIGAFYAAHRQGKRTFSDRQRSVRRRLRLLCIFFLILLTALFALCYLDPADGHNGSYLWLALCSGAECVWCFVRRHQLQ